MSEAGDTATVHPIALASEWVRDNVMLDPD